jgi:hypothetical protein
MSYADFIASKQRTWGGDAIPGTGLVSEKPALVLGSDGTPYV